MIFCNFKARSELYPSIESLLFNIFCGFLNLAIAKVNLEIVSSHDEV